MNMPTDEEKYVCCDCGHTQDKMVRCENCNSIRVAIISFLVDLVGPDWRKYFEDVK
jgi:primosomal protein N'